MLFSKDITKEIQRFPILHQQLECHAELIRQGIHFQHQISVRNCKDGPDMLRHSAPVCSSDITDHIRIPGIASVYAVLLSVFFLRLQIRLAVDPFTCLDDFPIPLVTVLRLHLQNDRTPGTLAEPLDGLLLHLPVILDMNEPDKIPIRSRTPNIIAVVIRDFGGNMLALPFREIARRRFQHNRREHGVRSPVDLLCVFH